VCCIIEHVSKADSTIQGKDDRAKPTTQQHIHTRSTTSAKRRTAQATTQTSLPCVNPSRGASLPSANLMMLANLTVVRTTRNGNIFLSPSWKAVFPSLNVSLQSSYNELRHEIDQLSIVHTRKRVFTLQHHGNSGLAQILSRFGSCNCEDNTEGLSGVVFGLYPTRIPQAIQKFAKLWYAGVRQDDLQMG
jgi:hypothetical protein